MEQIQRNYKEGKQTTVDTILAIESFLEKMQIFMELYPEYNYNINIEKSNEPDNKWILELIILKGKNGETGDKL